MNQVKHDKDEKSFYLPLDEGEVYVRYRMQDEQTMDLHKTFTSPTLRGKGLAGKVVESALEYALEHNLKVVATCPYVKRFMESNNYHQKFQDKG